MTKRKSDVATCFGTLDLSSLAAPSYSPEALRGGQDACFSPIAIGRSAATLQEKSHFFL